MSKSHQFNRLNMQAFANEGVPIAETTPLQIMERLAHEAHALTPNLAVNWKAMAELRPGLQAEEDIWLHLTADTSVPLTCQRCMSTVDVLLTVDQWYRFVASEAIAMAEDDESEEDLLVMEPQFDLLAVLEDEMLMALPLVPKHDECPVTPVMQAGEEALTPKNTGNDEKRENLQFGEKPNSFAVLAQLKDKTD